MKKFKAESQKLLDMMIHSIYTNKEIFLRELISNASDALDKMHVAALENKDESFSQDQFWIRLTPDHEKRTLTIEDSGIGMDAEELEENLGTIAHSGTAEFKQSSNEKENLENIIGQFGVGFYSAFMVADEVEVLSKKYGEGQEGHLWKSDGSQGFTIEPAEKKEHGTKVILHLRPNKDEENYDQYLDRWTLERLVKNYSNYIRYPIMMEVEESRPVKKPDAQSEGDQTKKETTPEYEQVTVDKTLNSMIPIWNKNKSELKDEDYIHFYQQEHFGMDKPLHWLHMIIDGTISYRAILYIPQQLPFDFYSRNFKKGLSLYSHGVKIMDHCEELLPDYFGFIQGVVASDDFSLNISRETLQENRQLMAIARQIENKLLDELKRMLKNDPEKYQKFFTTFGKQIKGGIYSSYGMNTDKLAPLLIFDTSKGQGKRSLDQIVEDLEEAQQTEKSTEAEGVTGAEKSTEAEGATGTEKSTEEEGPEAPQTEDAGKAEEEIGKETAEAQQTDAEETDEDVDKTPLYYVSGDSIQQIDKLPALKRMKAEGKEVLYCIEPIDEFAFKAMYAYKGHPFKSIQASDYDAEKDKEEETGLFKEMKKWLDEDVVAVRRSDRLTDDAVMLTSTGEISIDMEKTWARQGIEGVPMRAQKVLEINPKHPVYKQMQSWYIAGDYDKIREYTELLSDQARLIEGLPLKDPVAFAQKIQKLMVKEQ